MVEVNWDDIYIVGGGPSLKSFDFSRLEDRTTICVNSSLQDVPNPNIFITSDTWFCRVAATMSFWNKSCHKVIVINRAHKKYERARNYLKCYDEVIEPARFDGCIGRDKTGFATGGNSGFCGFQYAVMLNPKRIHLLGFDFNVNGGDHYHDRYRVGRNDLGGHAEEFIRALGFLEHEMEIYSYSPTSPLNSYLLYRELKRL